MVVGITGHQRLSKESLWAWVRSAIEDQLKEAPRPLIGLSSLAIGADQIFADLVLQAGGELRAIIPFTGYERTFDSTGLENYNRLITRAKSVEIVSVDSDPQMAFLSAGKRLIDLSDTIIAVWDGTPAKGVGGTGDAVNYAVSKGCSVTHINPTTKSLKILT